MDLDSAGAQLYGLPPGEFTATRDRLARQARTAGDRELADRIRRLRRPTTTAWVSNQVVRAEPAQARRLLALGDEFRQAYRELDGARIRELAASQRELVASLVRTARQVAADAGRPIGDDIARELEQLLAAAVADPAVGTEWARGQLSRPLAASTDGIAAAGFPVPAERARTAPAPGTATRKTPAAQAPAGKTAREAPTRRAPTRTAARKAPAHEREAVPGAEPSGTATRRDREATPAGERELRDSVAAKEAAERAVADAEERVRQADRRVTELRTELDRAERDRQAARDATRRARAELRRADRAVQAARRRLSP